MSEEREHASHRESHVAFLVNHHRALLAQHHLSHRERRRMQTCEEILDEARTVFAETGALDFSLSEIARRVGFTPAALYRYFDSKDNLIKALAERAMAGLAEALAGRLAGSAARRARGRDGHGVPGLRARQPPGHSPRRPARVAAHDPRGGSRRPRGAGFGRLPRGRRTGYLRRRLRRRCRAHGVRGVVAGARHGGVAGTPRPGR